MLELFNKLQHVQDLKVVLYSDQCGLVCTFKLVGSVQNIV